MLYTRKCPNCEKEFKAERPHGSFCSGACRQAYHRLPEKMSKLFEKLKSKQQEHRKILLQINLLIKQIKEHRIKHDEIKNRHDKSYNLLLENFPAFYSRLEDKRDPVTGSYIRAISSPGDYSHKENVKKYEESKRIIREEFGKLEEELDASTSHQNKLEVKLFSLRRTYKKLERTISAYNEQISELKQKFEPEVNTKNSKPLPKKPGSQFK